VLFLTRPHALTDADFVPLFLYFAYGSSMYLQIGAVAIVSLLTRGTIDDVLSEDKAAVALLKTAAATAAKTYTKSPSNSTLLELSQAAAATFSLADVALTQKKVDVAALLAFFAGVFSFGIGILKVGKVMNLMGPAVISGFQTAAAITIALGQFKNIFGYSSDFTQSSHIDDVIQSFIDLRPTLSTRATWSGWMWIAILFSFRQLGGITVRGRKPFNILKITGPVVLCIIAIVSTKLTDLHLSPGCTVYNENTGISNVYFANASTAQWNISGAPPDNPGCVPMPKSVVGSILPLPWPGDRGLSIVGTFGKPPTGNVHLRWEYVNGKLLTGAIIITLVASLESIAIAKALASKHRQADLDPNKEYVALGLANIFGSFTSSYPISGSFSRSALNDDLGASSPVAMLTVATIVGITLKIASTVPMFYYLVRLPLWTSRHACACADQRYIHSAIVQPQNALSAIVVIALLSLFDVHHFLWLAKYDRKDACLWLTAFLAVLFQGVEIGILIAVVISLGLVVIETILAPMPQLGLVPGSTRRAFRSKRQYPNAATVPGIRVFRIESPVIFANAPGVCAQLRQVVFGSEDYVLPDFLGGPSETMAAAASGDGEPVRAVVVDFSNVPYVDSAFIEGFTDLIDQYRRAEVLLCFANPNSNVMHKLVITKMLQALNTQSGEEQSWIFLTVSDAVEAVRRYEPPVKPRRWAPEEAFDGNAAASRGEALCAADVEAGKHVEQAPAAQP
jgi:MFS superfamily sulfate permease-like transporter